MTTLTAPRDTARDQDGWPPVGVLADTGLWLYLSGVVMCSRRPPPTSVRDAGVMAEEHELAQLWVLPSAMPAMGLPTGAGPWRRLRPGTSYRHPYTSQAGSWHVGTEGGGLRSSFSCWVPGTDYRYETILLEWEPQSPWASCATAGELLEELARWHRATRGALWRRSGAITSEAWLRQHYARSRVLEPTTVPDDCTGQLEADLLWHRHHAKAVEQRAPWCHAFDLAGMYLSAASSLALPTGEPNHYTGPIPRDLKAPLSKWPGYWRTAEIGWVTTPTLAWTGARVLESWVYPHHHRYLEPWYRMLRDARAELLPGGPALDAVKATYREGIGRLGSGRRARGDGDPLHQPYWRQAVIAEARTRLQRRIAKLPQGPVAVDVDALYFLTNTADPSRFAERIGLPMGDGLGTFHHRGSCAGNEARAALEEPDHHRAIGALREAMSDG